MAAQYCIGQREETPEAHCSLATSFRWYKTAVSSVSCAVIQITFRSEQLRLSIFLKLSNRFRLTIFMARGGTRTSLEMRKAQSRAQLSDICAPSDSDRCPITTAETD